MPKSPNYTLARIEAACRAAGLREVDIQRLLSQLESAQAPIGRPKNLSQQELREQEAERLCRMVREVAIERDHFLGYIWARWLLWKIRGELRTGTGSLQDASWSFYLKLFLKRRGTNLEESASTSPESRSSSGDAEGGK
jgi:hypothetical protein